MTVDMLEAEFAKFGALLGGKAGGIAITVPKFGGNKTAQVEGGTGRGGGGSLVGGGGG